MSSQNRAHYEGLLVHVTPAPFIFIFVAVLAALVGVLLGLQKMVPGAREVASNVYDYIRVLFW